MHTDQGTSAACKHCAGRKARTRFDTAVTMAFQPIFDVVTGQIFAHEALVRTPQGGSAGSVLADVTTNNRYSFDQMCRVKAVELASNLGLNGRLSINCMPNAVLDPVNCLRTTIIAARRFSFPIENIIFEFTETEAIEDLDRFKSVVAAYRQQGFSTAFDDFGSGHNGLALLSDLQPDYVKLDMRLVRGIDKDISRARIVDACLYMCMGMNIDVIVEGVETSGEFRHLRDAGARLFQGYLFGKPMFEGLVKKSSIPLPLAA